MLVGMVLYRVNRKHDVYNCHTCIHIVTSNLESISCIKSLTCPYLRFILPSRYGSISSLLYLRINSNFEGLISHPSGLGRSLNIEVLV